MSDPHGLLSPGDEVRWRSHGGSGASEKRGRIVWVVAAGEGIDALKATFQDSHDLSPVMLSGNARSKLSYLVEIPSSRRKPRLYWPRADHLVRCDDQVFPLAQASPHRDRQAPLFPTAPVRRLLDGSSVVSSLVPAALTVTTFCPGKWCFLDLETGQAYSHDGTRFKPLLADARGRAAVALNNAPEIVRGHHLRRRPRRAYAGDPAQ